MDGAARPHCLQPAACIAKTERHCAPCSQKHCGRTSIVALNNDPERMRLRGVAAVPRLQDPDFIARRIAANRKNKTWRKAVTTAGRAKVKQINADPELTRKRIEGIKASAAGRVERNAERLARKAGIPVELVAEYRRLRWEKHHDTAAAVAVLRASYPNAFAAIDAAAALDARRAAGPLPAPGTEHRKAWIRSVAEARP